MDPVVHFEMPYDDRTFIDTEQNRVSMLQPLPRAGQAKG